MTAEGRAPRTADSAGWRLRVMLGRDRDLGPQTHPPGLFDGHDVAAEREERDRDQLEVGDPEWDPDDGEAQRHARDDVAERQPPAAEQEPDHVADGGSRASGWATNNRATEGPEGEGRDSQ